MWRMVTCFCRGDPGAERVVTHREMHNVCTSPWATAMYVDTERKRQVFIVASIRLVTDVCSGPFAGMQEDRLLECAGRNEVSKRSSSTIAPQLCVCHLWIPKPPSDPVKLSVVDYDARSSQRSLQGHFGIPENSWCSSIRRVLYCT